MLKCYFLNESFAWSMVGCLGSLPVDAQQNPPDFGHLIRRNMSKGSAGEQKNIRIHFYQPGLQLNMSIWGVKLIWKKISPIGKIFLETSRNHAIFIPIGKKL